MKKTLKNLAPHILNALFIFIINILFMMFMKRRKTEHLITLLWILLPFISIALLIIAFDANHPIEENTQVPFYIETPFNWLSSFMNPAKIAYIMITYIISQAVFICHKQIATLQNKRDKTNSIVELKANTKAISTFMANALSLYLKILSGMGVFLFLLLSFIKNHSKIFHDLTPSQSINYTLFFLTLDVAIISLPWVWNKLIVENKTSNSTHG